MTPATLVQNGPAVVDDVLEDSGDSLPLQGAEPFGPWRSLAFWCCLAASALLFAALALAPRLRTYRDLRHDYEGRQRQLVARERHVDYLRRVVDALEHDPQYAAELARADFGVAGEEERISVDPQLSLRGAGAPPNDAVVAKDVPRKPFLQICLESSLIDSLCDDPAVRTSLMTACTLLVIVGFFFLSDSNRRPTVLQRPAWSARCRRWLAERYARTIQ